MPQNDDVMNTAFSVAHDILLCFTALSSIEYAIIIEYPQNVISFVKWESD